MNGVRRAEPHAAPLAEQVTDHLTPAFVESFASETVSDAVVFTWSEDGRLEEKEMEIGPGGVLIEEDPPPQAASAALVQMARKSEIHRWIDIVAPESLIRHDPLLPIDSKLALWCRK
jgi:hypothetical protein